MDYVALVDAGLCLLLLCFGFLPSTVPDWVNGVGAVVLFSILILTGVLVGAS